nr:RNA-directed DNA polymerase, eukaryota [Tanacetum cinerariifolium]
MVGNCYSRIKAWDDTILKLKSRLSKWKAKTLSIGGRLTLLKSVLRASPIYTMSIYKVPHGVLKTMESIHNHFFNGADLSENKITWVAWDKVLTSKKNGVLGVSSFFALNRALLLKWVWRFISQDGLLWYQVIRALYGSSVEYHRTHFSSNWCSILREVHKLKDKGFDFWSLCKKRIGDGTNTSFWSDPWLGNIPLKIKYPRLFSLKLDKDATVAVKLQSPMEISFRRNVRGWIEQHLMEVLASEMDSVLLSNSYDRWRCDLSSDGDFHVKEVRNFIDDLILPSQDVATRWVKSVPIKVNVFIWRARLDGLPTMANLVRRGVNVDSSGCPICSFDNEDINHILFRCELAQQILLRICRWWELVPSGWSSFQEWQSWFLSIRLPSKVKSLLEGTFYVAWCSIWRFRNRSIFDNIRRRRSEIEDYLYQKKLHEPLAEAKPTGMKAEDWTLLDRQALGAIKISLAKNVACNVSNEKTTYGLFKAMSNMYEKPNYVNEFNSNLSRLILVDITLSDEVQALLLLSLLPESWKTSRAFSKSLLSAINKGNGRKKDREHKQNTGSQKFQHKDKYRLHGWLRQNGVTKHIILGENIDWLNKGDLGLSYTNDECNKRVLTWDVDNLQMDDDDEIFNLVDIHVYMLCGGWKWQDLLRLALVDHH